jgi:hypothetical protein
VPCYLRISGPSPKKEKIVVGSIDWGIQKLVQSPIQLAQMIPQILTSIEKKDSECLANLQLRKFVEQAQKTEMREIPIWDKLHVCPQCEPFR